MNETARKWLAYAMRKKPSFSELKFRLDSIPISFKINEISQQINLGKKDDTISKYLSTI